MYVCKRWRRIWELLKCCDLSQRLMSQECGGKTSPARLWNAVVDFELFISVPYPSKHINLCFVLEAQACVFKGHSFDFLKSLALL